MNKNTSDLVEVSLKDAMKWLRKIKPNKSSREIPNWLLKEVRYDIVEILTHIIRCIFEQQKFPGVWKVADVTPIEKVKPL